MKKKLLSIMLLIVMMLGIFGLAGCDRPEGEGDTSLKSGFERVIGNDPIPGVFCAYTFNTFEMSAESGVEVNFYYGLVGDYITDTDEGSTSAKITAVNKMNTEIILREVENFSTDKYLCKMNSDHRHVGFTVEFSHSEVILVPMELFVGNRGHIGFNVQTYVHLFDSGITQKGERGSILLYYTVTDGRIMLSANNTEE